MSRGAKLMAVDPSLTCSGWALYSLSSGRILALGKIKSLAPQSPLTGRLKDLQNKIGGVLKRLKMGKNDVLICEAPTTMRDPRAAFKVEQVRCIFEVVARERGIEVPGRVNPRSVQYEVMGLRGRQLKREIVKSTAVTVVERLYGAVLKNLGFASAARDLKKHQDVVDAILIGACALARCQAARHAEQPLEQLFIGHETPRYRLMRRQ